MEDQMTAVQFHMPTKKITLIDAINRCAAATGSIGYARATAGADYNGHALGLYWNDYRRYYVCDYHWGERVVITRHENFSIALAASKREFARQGRGASFRVSCRPQDAHIAEADPDLLAGKESDHGYCDADPKDFWKFGEVGYAVKFNNIHHLISASSKEEYDHLRYGRAA